MVDDINETNPITGLQEKTADNKVSVFSVT